MSLDEAVADRLRNELVALTTRTQVTTLLVTHDLAEAVQLADRLFFLSDRPARIILEKVAAAAARRAQQGPRCIDQRRNAGAGWRRRRPDAAEPTQTSRLSIAKRTSSEDERKPSFWRMIEDVLAIVL